MKLSTAAEQFLLDQRSFLSRQTIENYTSDLKLLTSLATVSASDSVLSFNEELVQRYFRTLSEKDLKMATLHRRRASLNQFGKWGVRKRLWPANPVDHAPRIRRPKHLPRAFAYEERQRLLALDLRGPEAVLRAILYYGGLRVTECCTLRVQDVSLGDGVGIPGYLRVHGKGSKDRAVPIVPELRDALQEWMLSSADLTDPRGWLIRQRSGQRWDRRMVARRSAKWGRSAGIVDCTPHRMRHTTATVLLERGAQLTDIRDFLGHEDIGTTAIYLKVSPASVVRAAMLLSDRITGRGSVPHPSHEVQHNEFTREGL